jgi:hypothetical protein
MVWHLHVGGVWLCVSEGMSQSDVKSKKGGQLRAGGGWRGGEHGDKRAGEVWIVTMNAEYWLHTQAGTYTVPAVQTNLALCLPAEVRRVSGDPGSLYTSSNDLQTQAAAAPAAAATTEPH